MSAESLGSPVDRVEALTASKLYEAVKAAHDESPSQMNPSEHDEQYCDVLGSGDCGVLRGHSAIGMRKASDAMSSDPQVARAGALLEDCATQFAAARATNLKPLRPILELGTRGLEPDESRSFLRALDAELLRVLPDGEFTLPGAAHNLNRPHLVGEDGKGGVTLHTEYLVHIGGYAELILDHGWPPDRLAFDMGPWDLHGLRADGSISLLMEAKARFHGSDGLARLRDDLYGLARDPDRSVAPSTHKKYERLVEVCQRSPVHVWLVANAYRLLFRARLRDSGIELMPTDTMPRPE